MSAREAERVRRPRRSTAGTLIYVLLGPSLWGVHFALIYGSQSVLCATGGDVARSAVVIIVAVATIAVLVAAGGAVLRAHQVRTWLRAGSWPPPVQGFCDRVMALLATLSVLGAVWAGAAVFLVPACPSLR